MCRGRLGCYRPNGKAYFEECRYANVKSLLPASSIATLAVMPLLIFAAWMFSSLAASVLLASDSVILSLLCQSATDNFAMLQLEISVHMCQECHAERWQTMTRSHSIRGPGCVWAWLCFYYVEWYSPH